MLCFTLVEQQWRLHPLHFHLLSVRGERVPERVPRGVQCYVREQACQWLLSVGIQDVCVDGFL
jgi:hypothetical protein